MDSSRKSSLRNWRLSPALAAILLAVALGATAWLSWLQPVTVPPGRSWNDGDTLALAVLAVCALIASRSRLSLLAFSVYGLLGGAMLGYAVWINDSRDYRALRAGSSTISQHVREYAFIALMTTLLIRLIAARLRPRVPRQCGICQSCGYSLRGLESPRCPECGRPFVPAVVTPNSAA